MKTPSGIQVIARTAAVLRALRDDTGGISLGRIAERVGLPRFRAGESRALSVPNPSSRFVAMRGKVELAVRTAVAQIDRHLQDALAP